MKRNTSIQLLRLLSEEEVRRLGKFLRSPYFNYSQPIIILFEQLRKWHPSYEPQRIKPSNFWKKINPGEPFSEQKYWKLNFKLRCLIERFMAIEQMESNPSDHKVHLLRSHGNRKERIQFEKETKSLIADIENQQFRDIQSYNRSFWLKYDYFFNASTDKYGNAIYSVEGAMEELDRFYILAKLRLASETKNRERIFSKKTTIRLLDECISASHELNEQNPVFLLYKNVLELYDQNTSESAFKNGKQLLETHFSFISKNDQNEILLNLRNYAIRQLNKGKTQFWRELFDLYKLGLQLDLIIVNNKINEGAFLNIIQVGCEEEEFTWVNDFIKNYEKYLPEEVRADTTVLGLGILSFHKKNYNQTIEIINQHTFPHLYLQLNARMLAIKSWFELFLENKSLSDFLIAKLEADEKYLRRNSEIASSKKTGYVNFILATKKMIDLINNNLIGINSLEKMERYLSTEKEIVSKKWLIEKSKNLR